MMKEEISVMYSEEVLNKKIGEMAEQISKDYEGKSIHLICILKGSIFFCCELAKRLTVPVTIDFMSASSYGNEGRTHYCPHYLHNTILCCIFAIGKTDILYTKS